MTHILAFTFSPFSFTYLAHGWPCPGSRGSHYSPAPSCEVRFLWDLWGCWFCDKWPAAGLAGLCCDPARGQGPHQGILALAGEQELDKMHILTQPTADCCSFLLWRQAERNACAYFQWVSNNPLLWKQINFLPWVSYLKTALHINNAACGLPPTLFPIPKKPCSGCHCV